MSVFDSVSSVGVSGWSAFTSMASVIDLHSGWLSPSLPRTRLGSVGGFAFVFVVIVVVVIIGDDSGGDSDGGSGGGGGVGGSDGGDEVGSVVASIPFIIVIVQLVGNTVVALTVDVVVVVDIVVVVGIVEADEFLIVFSFSTLRKA